MDVEAGQPRATATISIIAQHCRHKLHECVRVQRVTGLHWAQNRLSDFNVWDAGVGASARQSQSLEVRLRDDDTATEFVVSALSTLRAWLDIYLRCDKDSTGEPEVLSNPTSPKFHVSLHGDISRAEAEESIEQLFQVLIKLGIAIRQAGSPSHMRNADRDFRRRKGEYKAFETEMATRLIWKKIQSMLACGLEVSRVQTRYDQMQKDMLKSMEEDALPYETQAIVEANARRRHRFTFAAKRANMLKDEGFTTKDDNKVRNLKSANIPRISPLEGVSSVSRAQDSVIRKRASIGPQLDTTSLQHSTHRSDRSQTSTTQLSTHIPDDRISTALEDDQPLAPPTATTGKVNYPTPPTVDPNATAFICPYCRMTLPRVTAQGKNWV
jgi:hypothetical protein